jgi:hypothetical protein
MANDFDFTGSRSGSNNGATDKRELFLKVFSGEVLSNYETKLVLTPLVRSRTIAAGKSATFPIYGKATAKWHTPGQNILEAASGYLSDFKFGERVINLDNMLTANTMIHDVDELMNHWDVRGPIATELGYSLARAMDGMAMRTMIAASRATNPISNTSGNGTALAGETITTGTAGSVSGTAIVDKLFEAQAKLDNKDVPEQGRFCILRPEQYNDLLGAAGTSTYAFRFSSDFGSGVGDVAKGTAAPMEIAGFKVLKSNLFPRDAGSESSDALWAAGGGSQANIANDVFGADGVGYGLGAANIDYWGVCGHADAIGVLKKLDVSTEMERKIEYQGTLVVSKLMAGFGVLRPECAIGFKWTA